MVLHILGLLPRNYADVNACQNTRVKGGFLLVNMP
jgi:hypothetical protein